MAPVLKRLYDQMPDPKYVIAMGACTISGGPFFYNTYSVVKGVDHVIPVAGGIDSETLFVERSDVKPLRKI